MTSNRLKSIPPIKSITRPYFIGAVFLVSFGLSSQEINKTPEKSEAAKKIPLNRKLLDAASRGNLGDVKKLISQGADPETRGKFGSTPLHVASTKCEFPVARYLIKDLAVNIDAVDRNGWTSLHSAALFSAKGCRRIARLLLKEHAHRWAKTTRTWSRFPAGSTPADIALRAKQIYGPVYGFKNYDKMWRLLMR